jgi:hypothetical protein
MRTSQIHLRLSSTEFLPMNSNHRPCERNAQPLGQPTPLNPHYHNLQLLRCNLAVPDGLFTFTSSVEICFVFQLSRPTFY